MIEIKSLQEFRVRLDAKELKGLLQATDLYCIHLVKLHILKEREKDKFLQQCNFDTNQNDQVALKWQVLREERKEIETKIRSLESLETEFEALLKGKRCGRRPKTAFNKERLWIAVF